MHNHIARGAPYDVFERRGFNLSVRIWLLRLL
jgi:hypothetical protein